MYSMRALIGMVTHFARKDVLWIGLVHVVVDCGGRCRQISFTRK